METSTTLTDDNEITTIIPLHHNQQPSADTPTIDNDRVAITHFTEHFPGERAIYQTIGAQKALKHGTLLMATLDVLERGMMGTGISRPMILAHVAYEQIDEQKLQARYPVIDNLRARLGRMAKEFGGAGVVASELFAMGSKPVVYTDDPIDVLQARLDNARKRGQSTDANGHGYQQPVARNAQVSGVFTDSNGNAVECDPYWFMRKDDEE